jgi:hypothetical protein
MPGNAVTPEGTAGVNCSGADVVMFVCSLCFLCFVVYQGGGAIETSANP